MADWFSLLQAANPGALWASLLVPLLVLAYLRKRSKRVQTVSSTLILGNLTKKKLIRKRFRPPLRFFLELLALLALLAGAALPSLKDTAPRIALIIDNSLSMRARNEKGSTRAEEAKKAAANWLDQQNGSSRFSVFFSSPKLTKVGDGLISLGEARRLLDTITPSYCSDSLEIALVEAAQSGEYEKVVVVTDREAVLSEYNTEDQTGSVKDFVKIEIIKVANTSPNFYFAGIHQSGAQSSKESSLSAAVAYSGPRAAEVSVNLYEEILSSSPGGSKKHKKLQSSTITVDPEQASEVVFSLPRSDSSDRVFSLELSPLGAQTRAMQNSIVEDDFAWISSTQSAQNRILLITTSTTTNALGLNAISTLSFDQVTPKEFSGLDSAKLTSYELLLFHRSAPASAPRTPTLLVLPPVGNPLFPIKGETDVPRITSWASEHPISSYLKVPLLKPTKSVIFEVPLWAKSIINGENGSLLTAGESDGIRFAGLGFELFPFEGSKTPALSVLTLNLFNWLTGGAELSRGLLAGSSFRLEDGRNWIIRTPRGTTERRSIARGKPGSFALDFPGIYSLKGVPLRRSSSIAELKRTIAVNSFFPAESSTFVSSYLAAPSRLARSETQKLSSRPLWPYFLWAAFALLIVDVLISFFTSKENAQGQGESHA